MRGVRVDPERRIAYVRGGSLLRELDEAAQEHGLGVSRRRRGTHGRRRAHARRGDGQAPAAVGLLDRQHGGRRAGDGRWGTAPRERGGTPRPVLGHPGGGAELRHRHGLRVPAPRARDHDHAGDAGLPGRPRARGGPARPRVRAGGSGRGDAVLRARHGTHRPGVPIRDRGPPLRRDGHHAFRRRGRGGRRDPPAARPGAIRRHGRASPVPRRPDVGRRGHGLGEALLHEGWVPGRALRCLRGCRAGERRRGAGRRVRHHPLAAGRGDRPRPGGRDGVHRAPGAVLAGRRVRVG